MERHTMDNYAETTHITSLTQEQLQQHNGIPGNGNITVGLDTNADSIPFEFHSQDFITLSNKVQLLSIIFEDRETN